jgi:hypothetical protein
VVLAAGAPQPTNVFEIDITPEEAQKYLNSPPFTEPQLSGRTAVLPLVRFIFYTYHSCFIPEGIAEAYQKFLRDPFFQNYLIMKNTADVTGGKPIAVSL